VKSILFLRKQELILVKLQPIASKMQTLLIDLVNYSRTIKGDKIYVDIDTGDHH
jgi:hypothetical protein